MYKAIKPIIGYVGAKNRELPIIWDHLPNNINLVIEPMCGSAVVSRSINARKTILNDFNEELINFFTCMKYYSSDIFNYVTEWPKTREQYYILLHQRPATNIIRAARYLYLTRYTSFARLYYKKDGSLTGTPRKDFRLGILHTLADKQQFAQLRDFLKGDVTLCNTDYRNLFNDLYDHERLLLGDNKPFVFFDPPYNDGTQLYSSQFNQIDLKELVDKISDTANIMICNSNDEYVKKLYSDYNQYEYTFYTRVKHKERKTLLITNY